MKKLKKNDFLLYRLFIVNNQTIIQTGKRKFEEHCFQENLLSKSLKLSFSNVFLYKFRQMYSLRVNNTPSNHLSL